MSDAAGNYVLSTPYHQYLIGNDDVPVCDFCGKEAVSQNDGLLICLDHEDS